MQIKRYALVVEDDILQRQMLTVLLQDSGFEILQCDNAESAIIILQEVGHDLTLLVADVQLNGEISGARLAAFARQLFPNIRVIITSGKSWPALPEGATFLRKPWKPIDLIREAKAALSEGA